MRSFYQLLCIGLSTLSIYGQLTGPAAALQDACKDAVSQGDKKLDDAYLPKIELWIKVSKALQDKGIDPHKYPVVMPDATVEVIDLTDVIKRLTVQRATGYSQVQQAGDECDKQFVPYQKAIDIATFFSTGGLSAVLPPQMSHVDASQILSGHPLGGPGALIPKMRDDLLNGLNIGGDVAGMIRDPLCVFKGHCS